MMRFGLLVIVVLAIAILPAQGEEHAPPPSKQKIKALVDRLVSPNPKPITEEEDPRVAPDLRLPPGFDREKQAPVLQGARSWGNLEFRRFPFSSSDGRTNDIPSPPRTRGLAFTVTEPSARFARQSSSTNFSPTAVCKKMTDSAGDQSHRARGIQK